MQKDDLCAKAAPPRHAPSPRGWCSYKNNYEARWLIHSTMLWRGSSRERVVAVLTLGTGFSHLSTRPTPFSSSSSLISFVGIAESNHLRARRNTLFWNKPCLTSAKFPCQMRRIQTTRPRQRARDPSPLLCNPSQALITGLIGKTT